MIIKVENGRRVEVSLPDFEGTAGLQEQGDGIMLAYVPNINAKAAARAGTPLNIDGEVFTVLGSPKSEVRRMRRLLLKRDEG